MSEVVIIGGGLSGLSAAWQLELLGVNYTLVEVKNRLGGSIITEPEGGFVIDGGAFACARDGDWSFLAELDLAGALVPFVEDKVMFKDGTQSLVNALISRLTNPVLTRMAVSTVGRLDDTGRFGICLENGMLMDARAVIVAAPARYAEHILHTLQPEVAYRLLGYHYDSVARVSLGYRREDVGTLPESPPEDYPITFWQIVTHPARVPDGHVMLRAGIRLEPPHEIPPDLPLQLAALMQLPLNPVVSALHYWENADSLTRDRPDHAANMTAIEHLLPGGVALVGSDYRAYRLDQQVTQGRAAAHQIADWLRKH